MGLNRIDDSATFIVEAENRKNTLKVTCSLAVKLAACQEAVRYSSGQSRKGKTTSTEVGYFIQARRGDSRPKTKLSAKRDQGGSIFIERFVEAIRETLIRPDILSIL